MEFVQCPASCGMWVLAQQSTALRDRVKGVSLKVVIQPWLLTDCLLLLANLSHLLPHPLSDELDLALSSPTPPGIHTLPHHGHQAMVHSDEEQSFALELGGERQN